MSPVTMCYAAPRLGNRESVCVEPRQLVPRPLILTSSRIRRSRVASFPAARCVAHDGRK